MIELSKRKLGKLPKKTDPRTFQLKWYLSPERALPPLPVEQSWVKHVKSWPMMLNDALGDCVIATCGHMIQQWTTYADPEPFVPSDRQILMAYEAVGGYVPGDPTTDNGCVILDALNYWRKTGIAGRKIYAFLQLDPKQISKGDLTQVSQSVQIFGNCYFGVGLPISAQSQNAWTVPEGGIYTEEGQPWGWGGHAIPVVAVSPKTLTCVTWGETLKMSHNFARDYCDEAYAVLSMDWVEANGSSPSGFDFAHLQSDLNQL